MKRWLLVILIVVVIGAFFGLSKQSDNGLSSKAQSTNIVEVPADTPLVEATNSEGDLKLVGVSRRAEEGRISYAFKVKDEKKGTDLPLYTTIADPGSSIAIPQNSWSPDYKQVFIKTSGPSGEDYYLFKASGEPYADGKKYIAVGDYWSATNTTNKVNKVSGWAGPDLLMVYTTKEDGTEGPAYWFVTSTRKFMQVREF